MGRYGVTVLTIPSFREPDRNPARVQRHEPIAARLHALDDGVATMQRRLELLGHDLEARDVAVVAYAKL